MLKSNNIIDAAPKEKVLEGQNVAEITLGITLETLGFTPRALCITQRFSNCWKFFNSFISFH